MKKMIQLTRLHITTNLKFCTVKAVQNFIQNVSFKDFLDTMIFNEKVIS